MFLFILEVIGSILVGLLAACGIVALMVLALGLIIRAFTKNGPPTF